MHTGLQHSSFLSFLSWHLASYPLLSLQSAAVLTLLSSGSLVEDLDRPADVQVEQSHGGRPLPLTFLLQGSQEGFHVDVGPSADPAAEPQGEAALLAVVPRHICLTVRAAPAPAALCCAWWTKETNTDNSISQDIRIFHRINITKHKFVNTN